MELHERMKRQALAEFESYRQRVEDMQLCTEAQVDRRTRQCGWGCVKVSSLMLQVMILISTNSLFLSGVVRLRSWSVSINSLAGFLTCWVVVTRCRAAFHL